MSGSVVSYIVELRDRFSAVAAQVAAQAQKAAGSLDGMGTAANRAERALNSVKGTGFANVTRQVDQATAAVNRLSAAEATQAKAREAYANKATVGIARLRAEREAAEKAAGGIGPMFSGRHDVLGHAMNAWLGYSMIKSGIHGAGTILQAAEDQIMAKRKMAMVGFKDAMMGDVDKTVEALVKKYPNMSRADILEQMYEGVAIHGDAAHALENVESQTRLAAFLKAFDGGKHGHRANEWNREVFAAIKSMEMMGTLNTHDPAKKKADIENYLGALMSMKALYGDQAKIQEYLTMQKRAGASWLRFSDEFRFGIAPAMMQERGGATVGQQLMTAFQTIVGGTKLRQNQVAAMRNYGLLDPKTGRFREDLITSYLHDPFEFNKKVVEAIAKKHRLNPNDEAQAEKLQDLLVRAMGFIFPNRNAAGQAVDMAVNHENYRKHAEAMKAVRKELDAYARGADFASKTLRGSIDRVGRRWVDFLAELGRPFVGDHKKPGPAIHGLNWMSDRVNDARDWMKGNPGMVQNAGFAAAAAGALTLAAALSRVVAFVGKWTGISWAVRGLASGLRSAARAALLLGSRIGFLRLGAIGGAFMIGAEVWQNWSNLCRELERLTRLDTRKMVELKTALEGLAVLATQGAMGAIADAVKGVTGQKPEDRNNRVGPMPALDPMGMGAVYPGGDSLPRSVADTITVRSEFNVTAPPAIDVRVTGTVNGPVSGNASIPLSVTAPRGQTEAVKVPGPKVGD